MWLEDFKSHRVFCKPSLGLHHWFKVWKNNINKLNLHKHNCWSFIIILEYLVQETYNLIIFLEQTAGEKFMINISYSFWRLNKNTD